MTFRFNNWYALTLAVCLIPLLWLLIDTAFDNLGANPIQALHIRLGDWSLRLLWLTLAITPLQTLTGWRGMAEYRQLLGMYAFFYASLHVLAYLLVDHAFAWPVIGIDILESQYLWFRAIFFPTSSNDVYLNLKC